ncbi:SH3 domain-containing protein [Sulfitobacter donghicola]|uniref:SH3, type 3 n=1 Tax=Sulfitobacter donghicola DSW-25 = KCTC 12864 = JCM 14565 TaxID=1300350 RepID=A0A073J079_9RHOB|nr:SH3 domain-containing protein [Sulfitobacter donghicola]KEJ91032.1 SH3, type 3 [Sulfitobacter donghicola DSW-25 = KCTC 12864 = JCM 14565]KIN68327.1 SH3, type 3 [Sulfitobacter donghicola DSW-25 = KCTC 12864 = JCM 14565]
MKTFILLTFGFLAFAFYELSGGSDFQPASARLAAEAPEADEKIVAAAEPPAAQEAPSIIDTASIAKIDSTPDVTRVSLSLTNVSEAAEEATTTEAKVIDSVETPQIILPSLIATTDTTAPQTQDGDIRTVSGNRVNVRGGPSTDYGIVNKLTRGVSVEVLEDNGNGWVRMQPLDGGEPGWMADFLLTSG